MTQDVRPPESSVQWTGEDVFEIEARLGDGPHGTVYRGVQAGSGALLAIKEMQVGSDDQAKMEIETLKKVPRIPEENTPPGLSLCLS